MKTKIFILFFLLTISAFGKFTEDDETFSIFEYDIYNSKVSCLLSGTFINEKFYIVIIIDSAIEPSLLQFANGREYKLGSFDYKDGAYTIAIGGKDALAILNDMLDHYFEIRADKWHAFNFHYYSKPIIKSKVYKKLIGM